MNTTRKVSAQTEAVYWTGKDVLRFARLKAKTLESWLRKRWLTPAIRGVSKDGHKYSTSQLIGLIICSDTLRRERRIGGVAVAAQMRAFDGLSDNLLIDKRANPEVSEASVDLVGRAVITKEVTPEILEGIARVLAALDKRVNKVSK